ncbi:MAG TPA: glycosyl hydrolase, partial [Gemmatimonadales bacterium]|nr:glycosyl hydrolase [Gemmatimonadales bacterium]
MNRIGRMFVALAFALPAGLTAQQYPASLFNGLHWRSIGPFRGGRTVGATGVPGHPHTFLIGVNNGGVWKTDDAGRTWLPVFDAESTGSVGAVAVAPSDPNTIYVGSGEGLQRPDLSVGDGIYKSTDGGATWAHLGLRDGQQIPAVIVDPHDPTRVFAAVLGHPYGPNAERGVFRSTDGGRSWEKVLYKDENTGAFDVVFNPANPQTVFAVLWSGRQAPWEIGGSFVLSANNGLYKSTDGGTTWRQITAGLPGAGQGLGRIGLAVSPSEPARMYAVIGADSGGGPYRSDDGGEHWQLRSADPRVWGRDGDFNEVKVNPKDADVVYIANVVTWKSTDGGATFQGWRGAPGGDDYHRLWINPEDPNIILLAGDQGALVTLNDGRTWSSWFNQPTAQFYHVSTDNGFPYRVYGGQQESGSAGVWSRGSDGEINFRDWHPVGAEEYGYVAPDPLNPNLVYGGKLSRYDWRTGQVQDVSPEAVRSGKYRWVRTMPVLFSPIDPHVLYLGSNVLFKTRDGGDHWQVISPDLTRQASDTPAVIAAFEGADPERGSHRGVIYTVAPSFKKITLLWAGTDDGLIWVTHDGGTHWAN